MARPRARPRTAPRPGDLDAFRPGVTVIHPEYGLGRIVAIDGAGPNRKGRVAFTVGGERTFVLAKSPLRPVGKQGGSEASDVPAARGPGP